MSKDTLNNLRRKIEDLDVALLKLLNERAEVSVQIGKLKAQDGLSVYDRCREEAIYRYLAQHSQGPLKISDINKIFGEIISVSRKLQSSIAGNESESQVKSGSVSNKSTPSGNTSVYGIMGNPVAHSMSPLMHNAAFRLLGIDAIYLPFEVKDLPSAVAGMRALQIRGASVTHPFKTRVLELIDEIDITAKKVGAVNTLVLEGDSIYGTNTDWAGAVRSIEGLLPIKNNHFVVVGAGGAARAVVYGITRKGGKVTVVNRTRDKGLALAETFDASFAPLVDIVKVSGDCLINTTSVGMYPKVEETPVPQGVLSRYKAVVDIIYNPFKTRLLKEAESAGCMVANGLDMFIFQGVEQFKIWTGEEPPVQQMKDLVVEELETT
ncbi:MAG: shikimate dehydrogenase [Deltaproteobacteria bacterium]|nr:shikimate dehydrogenase [Deltaproteobacteria bacterium]MBW2074196.1 shikimate dehydrogenase [Deltaproteobacteria bacterium]